MTLVLGVANDQSAILIADRQITAVKGDKRIPQEPRNKIGLAEFRDGRFAFAYTGLASLPGIDTDRWILETLLKTAPPDYLAPLVMERFRDEATATWRSISYTTD